MFEIDEYFTPKNKNRCIFGVLKNLKLIKKCAIAYKHCFFSPSY